MRKSILAVSLILAGVASVRSNAAQSKPADLPSNNQIECIDCEDGPKKGSLSIELGISPKGITLKVGLTQPMADVTPSLDTVMPAYLEQMLQHLGDMLAQPGRSLSWRSLFGDAPYVRSLGESSPRGDAEEQDDPNQSDDPESMFRNLRGQTIPLGLVEVSY